jgi:hypothetical protein
MNKLQEIYEAKARVVSEKKSKDGTVMNIMVPFIQADERNKNGRIYSKSLLQREITRVQGSVKRGSFIGTGDHPISGLEDIATASHIVTRLTLDEKGKGMAELRILPTERGKTIQTLIKNNAQLGVSIRGFGDVGKDGVVANSYKLVGLDVVMKPSFKGAVFDKSNIFESVEFSEENEDKNMKNKLMGLSEDYVQEMLKDCYEIYVKDDGFEGTFADFNKHFGNVYLAEILVSEGKCANTEEALKHLGVKKDFKKQISALDKKTYSSAVDEGFKGTWQEWEEMLGHLGAEEEIEKISSASIQKKITPGEIYLEARSAGVDPKIYAEKINKNVELQEQGEEERRAVREAQSPGRTRFVQKEEIYPDGEKRIVWVKEEEDYQEKLGRIREGIKDQQRKVLTEDERAEIVARETGSTAERVKEIWAFERKKKEKEQKELAHYRLINMERAMAGFGGETRPDSLKRSRRILEREEK